VELAEDNSTQATEAVNLSLDMEGDRLEFYKGMVG